MRLSSKGNGISVLIESTTSSGESHGLYDYEKKTKFNQTLSIDDTRRSYIVFIKNETGQLIVQPEFSGEVKLYNDFGQDYAQDLNYMSIGASASKVPDIGKEFVPILRLYLSKNSWFVEVFKDTNMQLRTSSVHSSQSQSVPGCGVDPCFRPFSKGNSSRGRGQYKEDDKVWLVAPKTSPGIPLVKGDLLKFGRCKMVIHDIIATSSVAKEESSKVPFLPLLGLQDLRTDSGEPHLRTDGGSFAEVESEPETPDYSASYLLEKVFGSYPKGDAREADDLTGNSKEGSGGVACGLMLSSSISNNATCENLNVESFPGQTDHQAAQAGKSSPSAVSPGAEMQVQDRFERVVSHRTQKTKVTRCCRICLSDDGEGFADSRESLNPLICPCECKGSMQYVHLQCLRTWLESRLEIPSGWFLHTGRDSPNAGESPPPGHSPQQPTQGAGSSPQIHLRDRVRFKVISLFRRWVSRLSSPSCKVNSPACLHLRKFECELCKVYFPTQLRLVDHDVSGSGPGFVPLYRVPRPRFPYLVLIPLEGDFSSKIGQIVVSFGGAGAPVCIGRGHSSDIRLGEISVSRSHAQFQHCYSSGSYQICLLDMKSKFGSLVEFARPIKLGRENLSIQVGRTLVSLKTFRPNGSASNVISLFSGCIGRRVTISGIQELKAKSQRTKSVNLTFDSSSELLGFGDSELTHSLRNVSGMVSNSPEDPHCLDGVNKQLHCFRDASGRAVPRRHSYIFDP